MRKISLKEVNQHNNSKDGDVWLVVDGKVYDVGAFLEKHPGGRAPLEDVAGQDVSRQFHMLHEASVLKKSGEKYCIGELSDVPSDGALSTWQEPVFKPSSELSMTSGGTAHLLPAERQRATFDVEKMTNVLYAGEAEKRRFILHPTKTIGLGYKKYDMTREEAIAKHVSDFVKIHRPFTLQFYRPSRNEVTWMSEAATNTGSLMPHFGLFVPTILGQGSDMQIATWLPRALTFQIVGSYSQTELSHGSNVRGLQTTATYEPETQMFVINTPHLGATKWWNSNAGIVATHAAVFAQLIIKGKEYGVHVFFVQLRDENHQFLEGVMAGDVGVKLGDNGIDTSWIQFRNVRVPREHLFAKRQHVEPDGKYVKHGRGSDSGTEHAHYLTMMNARSGMVQIAAGKLAIACTIAARYSCVRLQGFVDSSSSASFRAKENPIIDYQNQRYRVLKHTSIAYAMRANGLWMAKKMEKLQEAATTNTTTAEEFQEVHVAAAAMKGICTLMAHLGIEDCRKACGGHGYLLNSGVGLLTADYAWQVSAEGDYLVMLLQAARYLLKSFQLAKRGEKLSGLMDCLIPLRDPKFNPTRDARPKVAMTAVDARDHGHLIDLFRYRVLVGVSRVGNQFDERMARPGANYEEAFNSCALSLQSTAFSFGMYFMLRNFLDVVQVQTDPHISRALGRLLSLFALSDILDGKQWNGLIDAVEIESVEAAVSDILDELRPDVVALVDAFDFPDSVLNSTIGSYDGNVYERLFDAAFHAPLNEHPDRPFAGYEELRKSLDLEFLKLRNQPSPELRDDDARAKL